MPKTVEWYSMERGPQMFKFFIFVNFIFLRPFFGQKQVSDTARWEGGPHISERYIFCQLKIIFLRRFFLAKNRWVIRQGGREALIFSITKKIIFRSIICQTFFAKNRWVIRQAGGEALTWPSAIPLSRPTALPPNIWVGKKGFDIWDLVKISWIYWRICLPLNCPWPHKLEKGFLVWNVVRAFCAQNYVWKSPLALTKHSEKMWFGIFYTVENVLNTLHNILK